MSKKSLLHLPESLKSPQEPFLKKRKKEAKLVSFLNRFLKVNVEETPLPLTRKSRKFRKSARTVPKKRKKKQS